MFLMLSLYFGAGLIYFFSDHKRIRELANSYVIPWQQYLVVKTLLVKSNAFSSNLKMVRQHIKDLIQFLDATNRTMYLRRVLTMPTPSYVSKGEYHPLLRYILRTARLDSLSSMIRALEYLNLKVIRTRENEVASRLTNIIARILPNFDKIRREIAEKLLRTEDLEEVLLFGIDEGEYRQFTEHIGSPAENELQIWKNSITEAPYEVMLTEKKLKRKALLYISMPEMMLGLPAVLAIGFALRVFTSRSFALAYSPIEGAFYVFGFTLLMGFCIVTSAIIAPKSVGNYLKIGQFTKGRVVFTRTGIEACAIDITTSSFDQEELPDSIRFGEHEIDLKNFLYRCACVFIPEEPLRAGEPLVSMPTSHMLRIGAEKFHCSEARVETCSLPSSIFEKRFLTRQELVELSDHIASSFERHEGDLRTDKNVKKIIWLYLNALRLDRFEEIELSEVGTLPLYKPAEDIGESFPESFIDRLLIYR